MWSWTMSWEPRPLRNMQHLRSIFSRHRFLLINETLILWSMNWLPYFLFVWTDQYGICKILNKYHLCKISRNVDILRVVLFIISSWKNHYIHICILAGIKYTCMVYGTRRWVTHICSGTMCIKIVGEKIIKDKEWSASKFSISHCPHSSIVRFFIIYYMYIGIVLNSYYWL